MNTPERTSYVTVTLTLADVQHIRNLLRNDKGYFPIDHPQWIEGQIQNELVGDALDAATSEKFKEEIIFRTRDWCLLCETGEEHYYHLGY